MWQKRAPSMKKDRSFEIDFAGLDVIASALLHLDQPPAPGLGVVDIVRDTSNADGVGNKLDLVLHTGRQLSSLGILVDVHLLGPASDDKNRNVTRVEHPRLENINTTNVENASVGLETSCEILLGQSLVDGVLSFREPKLQRLNITLDIGLENFGQDVLAQLHKEVLHVEAGVVFANLLDDLGGLVLGEETADLVGDTSSSGDERIFGLLVDSLQAENVLNDLVGVAEIPPCLLPGGILVDNDVGSGAEIRVSTIDQRSRRTLLLLGIFLKDLRALAG